MWLEILRDLCFICKHFITFALYLFFLAFHKYWWNSKDMILIFPFVRLILTTSSVNLEVCIIHSLFLEFFIYNSFKVSYSNLLVKIISLHFMLFFCKGHICDLKHMNILLNECPITHKWQVVEEKSFKFAKVSRTILLLLYTASGKK